MKRIYHVNWRSRRTRRVGLVSIQAKSKRDVKAFFADQFPSIRILSITCNGQHPKSDICI